MAVQTLEFLVFAAAQVGTPGPANMTLLASGARFGLRPALPFVGGVILGKQLIIWPIGFGVMAALGSYPWIFAALKWLSVAYILWLAWRVAFMSLDAQSGSAMKPGFFAGLWVHPLNPKAWAMIVAGFTSFIEPETPVFWATFVIGLSLLAVQSVLHPMWCLGGQWLAMRLAGSGYERPMMVTLALLTVVSVIYVLGNGGR